MKSVLITGATGFLGRYLVLQFLQKGYQVFALGRNKKAGEELEALGVIFCHGDFVEKETCAAYFQGVDYVVHAGALSTVWGEWEDFYQTNVIGTQNVCELCVENQVKRLVYVSSPSIYSGKSHRYHIKEEEFDSANTLNYYIRSKIQSEEVVSKFQKKGLYTVTIRPRGLIGIGDTSLIPRILKANGKIGIPLFNGGRNYVDITCVENVAYACFLCMEKEKIEGEIFNISNGEPMLFRQILEKFLHAIGEQPHYLKLPFWLIYGIAFLLEIYYKITKRSGEPALTRYTVCTLAFSQTLDISRAREQLGYEPVVTISEGIQKYGEWWKENNRL